MKTNLRKAAYILVGLIVLFFIISLTLPRSYDLNATTEIRSQLECPFNIVNNLQDWPKWDSWIKHDESMELTFSNPPSGEGAICRWTSSDKTAGNGKVEITEVVPGQSISTTYSFENKREATTTISFTETDNKVTVTRRTTGEVGRGPLAKYNLLFTKGKRQKRLRQGLLNMKNYCEGR